MRSRDRAACISVGLDADEAYLRRAYTFDSYLERNSLFVGSLRCTRVIAALSFLLAPAVAKVPKESLGLPQRAADHGDAASRSASRSAAMKRF